MAKKDDSTAAVIAAINKSFPRAAIRLSGGAKSDVKEVIPTGLSVVDKYILGVGGLAVGRISETFSEYGVGKTSLLLTTMGACQRAGGLVIMVETESALDSPRAKVFGVDLEKVVLLQPEHIMQAGQQIEAALAGIPAGVGPVLIGWDSIAATRSKQEAEEGLPEKESFDKRGKDFSQMMRVLGPQIAKSRAHLMLINQVRANIGVMFGDKFTTPCGNAIKFHTSIRLQLFGGKAQKDAAGQHEGKDITIMAVKNKLTRPYRKARIRLNYDKGWDDDWSTLNHAKQFGVADARSRDHAGARKALDAIGWSTSSANPAPAQEAAGEDDDVHDDEGL